ncbi:MAG: hypothetical protein L6R35_000937 [Caloplaca aegaea]|nr:MAG: hypothetical protein L6R35_000937 [Caloplaca aegaea]
MHPPPLPGQGIPNGPPGALSADTPGPTTPLPVGQINEQYLQQHQNVSNRLEADRGYDSVFSQRNTNRRKPTSAFKCKSSQPTPAAHRHVLRPESASRLPVPGILTQLERARDQPRNPSVDFTGRLHLLRSSRLAGRRLCGVQHPK